MPVASPIPVGTMAPYFSGIDQFGDVHSLETLKESGPAVIIFYRGNWCNYCMNHLQHYKDYHGFLKDHGVNIAMITHEGDALRTFTTNKTKVEIPIIIDFNHSIMKSYKVAYPIDQEKADQYAQHGAELRMDEDFGSQILPVPATYIVNQKGLIDFVQFDTDVKNRSNIKQIRDHLKI